MNIHERERENVCVCMYVCVCVSEFLYKHYQEHKNIGNKESQDDKFRVRTGQLFTEYLKA